MARKTHCPHGHEIAVVGRRSSGKCCECDRIKKRQYQRDRTNYRAERKREANDYKLSVGCKECGYKKSPYALHLHHRDPTQKRFCIGEGWNRSIGLFQAEVAKCDVLCANCHAELTWGK